MTQESKNIYLEEIKKRISTEMPKIINEVSVYEKKLVNGQLTKNPKISPQFNA